MGVRHHLVAQHVQGALAVQGDQGVLPLSLHNGDVRTGVVRPEEIDVGETVVAANEDVDQVAVDVPVHRPLNVVDATFQLRLKLASSSDGPTLVLATSIGSIAWDDGLTDTLPVGKREALTNDWYLTDLRGFGEAHSPFLLGFCLLCLCLAGNQCPATL